jgi:exopolyphosphatase/guanosine-5'-triphosphate,3'-diphosphate pyrophosphatase
MNKQIYAVIDFGSNSVNMAIYDLTGGRMKRLKKSKEMLGILGYIQKRRITHAGIAKSVEVVAALKKKADDMGANVLCFATASLRGVKNAHEVTAAILEETGISVDVMSWQREAHCDYLALVKMMDINDAVAVDIGGGSTEIVQIQNAKLTGSASLPVGSLRLYQDYVAGIRPETLEIEKMQQAMNTYLDSVTWAAHTGSEVLHAIGGTARAVAKLHKAVFCTDDNKKGYTYSAYDLTSLLDYLSESGGHFDVIAKLMAERIHVITPGLIALRAVAQRTGVKSIVLSKYGVREGYLIEKVLMQGDV